MKEKCFFVYKNETIIAILCVVYRDVYGNGRFFGAAHTQTYSKRIKLPQTKIKKRRKNSQSQACNSHACYKVM